MPHKSSSYASSNPVIAAHAARQLTELFPRIP
jgi:hypothetical protein